MRSALRRLALLSIATIVGSIITVAPPAAAVPGDDPTLEVSTWMSDLFIPWDVAFLPDGSALVTQRDEATILLRRPDGTVRQVDADLRDVEVSGEGGLMAIVVDPDFDRNRRFYTCQSSPDDVQVVAWRLRQGVPSARRVADPLVGGIDRNESGRHSGCRLRFDHAGHLIIATGDAAIGTNPRDRNSLAGKTLRVDPSTGRGVAGNPFIDRRGDDRIYTFGHRNIQGLDRRPCTDQMWTSEHGSFRDDEINLLRAGGDYGWNPVPGYDESVPMTDPSLPGRQIRARWSSGDPTVAISGAGWLRGAAWGAWDGQLAGATLKDSRLMVFGFSSRDRFTGISIPGALDLTFGRLRTPVQGPDGALYVTSDSTGTILRVEPVGAPTPGTQDLDGDGIDDLVVGAPGARVGAAARAGAIVVLEGDPAGVGSADSSLHTRSGLSTQPTRPRTAFGASVAYGDVDGDGTTDVAVASPGETVGGRRAAGAVTVVCGRTDGLGQRSSQSFAQGGDVPGEPSTGATFGSSVAFGDFDGDGHDDLAVGAPGQRVDGAARAGTVTVLEGTSAGLRTDSAVVLDAGDLPGVSGAGRRLGSSLAVGDLDGDGRDDLVIGAPSGTATAGLVVVVPGSRRGLVASRAVVRTLDSVGGTGGAGDRFGEALAVGDLDDDGIDDLAIGAPGADGTGAVAFLRGDTGGVATEGRVLVQAGGGVDGAGVDDRFGAALAAGDLDGDGIDDLAVAVPGEQVAGQAGAGRVAVFAGSDTGPGASPSWSLSRAGDTPGEPARDESLGFALRIADLDGDGVADLAVGVPGATVAGRARAGAVLVYPGAVGGPGSVTAEQISQRGAVPGEPGTGAHFGAGL